MRERDTHSGCPGAGAAAGLCALPARPRFPRVGAGPQVRTEATALADPRESHRKSPPLPCAHLRNRATQSPPHLSSSGQSRRSPQVQRPSGTRLSLAASGVPATVCQRRSGCQQRATARQVPRRQSPGRAARLPASPPGSPAPARRASVCAPVGAAPSLRAPGLCALPGQDGGAGGSGAPALGRPFPELARPG